MKPACIVLSRREVLAGTGALIMSFAAGPPPLARAAEGEGGQPPLLPGVLS